MGGWVHVSRAINKVLVLDTGQWEVYNSEMPTARSWATAVNWVPLHLIVVGGKAVVNGRLLLYQLLSYWTAPMDVDTLVTTILPTAFFYTVSNALYICWKSSSQVYYISLKETLSNYQVKWQSLTDTPWHGSHPIIIRNVSAVITQLHSLYIYIIIILR